MSARRSDCRPASRAARTRGAEFTALAVAALVLLASRPAAHDGPPYPLAVDQDLAGRTLTLYADPDVGTGTFYLYLDPAERLDELSIRIGAQPADGRLPEAFVPVVPVAGAPYQAIAEVPFDRRGAWRVRLAVEGGPGAQTPPSPRELLLDVEVTPPGSLGPLDVAWFLAPFAAIAFLWLKAMRQRRRAADLNTPHPETP